MNQQKDKNLIIQRSRQLREMRRDLIAMSPEDALKAILDDKRALEIVHSFPEEDLHHLIYDIGAADALPLLSLASNKQWEYFLDIEVWQKDRLDVFAATQWLNLLFVADPNRLSNWCMQQKIKFIAFFLLKNVEIRIREYDQSPSDIGEDFFTFDETLYFRILEHPVDMDFDAILDSPHDREQYQKDRKRFLLRLLKQMSEIDYQRFRELLLESAAIIPAEKEEEIYRLRNARLAEKGFMPFEEAIGVYQPLSSEDIKRRPKKHLAKAAENEGLLPTPFYANNLLKKDNPFTDALSSIVDEHILMQLQSEFANLCNQLMAADQKNIKGKSELKAIVNKASAYIGIGLEKLLKDKTESIQQYPLSDIFRAGYGSALRLKHRTESWYDSSWFTTEDLPLNFWDEDWLGVIGGLLLKRPLFFDNYKTGVLYREFLSSADIAKTEKILEQIISCDRLLSLLPFQIQPIKTDSKLNSLLTYKNLILTYWAADCLNPKNDDRESPVLPFKSFQSFFEILWEPGKKPRTIKLSVKQSFLKWLSEKSGLTGTEITEKTGETLENLFHEIENDYGSISVKDLDPRYIQLFLILK